MGKGNGVRRNGIGDGDGVVDAVGRGGLWSVLEMGVGMGGGGRRVLDMGVDRGEGP